MRFLFLSLFFLGCFRASFAQNGSTTTNGTDNSAGTTLVSTTVSAGYPTTSNESQPTELPFSTSNTSTGPLNKTTQPTEPQSTSVPVNGSTTVQATDSSSTSQGAGSVAVANPTFNVASFVGGMALIVALQGIAFFAYKLFKSRSSNYQHLGDTDSII